MQVLNNIKQEVDHYHNHKYLKINIQKNNIMMEQYLNLFKDK